MKIIWKILSGILGVILADFFVPGVNIKILPKEGSFFTLNIPPYWQIVVLVGATLGIINYFIKPILNLITLPLKVLTLGFFGIILNMTIIWFLDILFVELEMIGIIALFWSSLIFWLTESVFDLFYSKIKKIF